MGTITRRNIVTQWHINATARYIFNVMLIAWPLGLGTLSKTQAACDATIGLY